MRPFLFSLLLATSVQGGGPHEPLAEPKAILRMVEALEKSHEDCLSSNPSSDGGTDTYHLSSIKLLGTVSKGNEVFYLAEAFYIRSRNAGSDTPPARGHSFLVVFRRDFTIASFCRDFAGGCRLEDNVLMRGDEILVDFGKNDYAARHHGYGAIQLPYFFSDRITDEQWADDDFPKKDQMKDK